MVPSDITVICNFTGQYTLEVEYGSGSGSYAAGSKVAISAVEAPQGRKFASWKIKEVKRRVRQSYFKEKCKKWNYMKLKK